MQQALGLSDPVEVTICVSAPERGSVCVNGRNPRPEDGQTLVYFPEYSITVSAEPVTAARFLGWEIEGDGYIIGNPDAPVAEVAFNGPVTITALFE